MEGWFAYRYWVVVEQKFSSSYCLPLPSSRFYEIMKNLLRSPFFLSLWSQFLTRLKILPTCYARKETNPEWSRIRIERDLAYLLSLPLSLSGSSSSLFDLSRDPSWSRICHQSNQRPRLPCFLLSFKCLKKSYSFVYPTRLDIQCRSIESFSWDDSDGWVNESRRLCRKLLFRLFAFLKKKRSERICGEKPRKKERKKLRRGGIFCKGRRVM